MDPSLWTRDLEALLVSELPIPKWAAGPRGPELVDPFILCAFLHLAPNVLESFCHGVIIYLLSFRLSPQYLVSENRVGTLEGSRVHEIGKQIVFCVFLEPFKHLF